MNCFCENESFSLKVEADYVPDPVWCNICNCNIDVEELPLSEELKTELRVWASVFGIWRDKNTDKLATDAYEMIKRYNNRGLELTKKVRIELDDKYTVEYYPSS